MAEDLEQRLREAEARLRENLNSFDAEVDWQMSTEAERADLWTDIDVNVEDLRTLLEALSTSRARSEALEKALEPFAQEWRPGQPRVSKQHFDAARTALSLKQEGKGNG